MTAEMPGLSDGGRLPVTVDDTILEVLPAAVYVCDAGGLILRYNRRSIDLWGRAPKVGDDEERFCGAHRLIAADGTTILHSESPMAGVLRTGQPVRDQEVIIERPDGHRINVLVNIEPLVSEAGNLVGAVNCFLDISARKSAEEQARKTQELLASVVETTPECVKIVAQDGKLLQMNRAGCMMLGAAHSGEVEGTQILERIAPEHREVWSRNHDSVCSGNQVTWEFDVIGLSGKRRQMESHAVPLTMPDGTVAQLAVTRDITKRKSQERMLSTILQSLPAAIYTTDPFGRITMFNEAAEELWGVRPEIGQNEWCGSWRLFWPDGSPMAHEECPMAVAIREQRPICGEEAIAEQPGGKRISFLAYPTPLHDDSGALVGAVNMMVDITQRKKAEEHQWLLINELNHRVKNTLANVQSIASQSFRSGPGRHDYKRFEGRLLALSHAHDVLTRENWEHAWLHEIVAAVTAPLRGGNGRRTEINGPALQVPPRMAVSLAMAVHELCTNAAKYGALSNGTGTVAIGWNKSKVNGSTHLHFEWRERDGPAVEMPQKEGFGTRLIRQGLSYDLGAKVELAYRSEGVVCTIEAPLPSAPPAQQA